MFMSFKAFMAGSAPAGHAHFSSGYSFTIYAECVRL